MADWMRQSSMLQQAFCWGWRQFAQACALLSFFQAISQGKMAIKRLQALSGILVKHCCDKLASEIHFCYNVESNQRSIFLEGYKSS
jgi:hypothetical protein